MGHYNVHCCLSGVPIEYGDEVVAWPLQKEYARGIGYRESWIPAGLPIMGWYDSYGGVDDVHGNILLSGDQHIAMCHMKMWTQLTDFWDNRDGSIKDEDLLSQIRGAREKHKKDQDFLKKEVFL